MRDTLWSLVPWGYQILLGLEGIRSGFLTLFFSMITELGSPVGYLVILSPVYWCLDKHAGIALAYCSLFSATVNVWLKQIWSIPRPGDAALDGRLREAGIDRRVTPLKTATLASFPSGHSQGAVVTWGKLAQIHTAREERARWVWVAALILSILVAFSRLYLGVHFPQDVVAGLALGAIYLALWLWAEPRARSWLVDQSLGLRLVLALFVPLVALILVPGEDTAAAMGGAMGMGVGYLLDGRMTRFSAAGALPKRLLRGVLGLALLIAAYLAFSQLFGLVRFTGPAAIAWRALRYALLGFVGGWGAPWVFVRTGLAAQEEDTDE